MGEVHMPDPVCLIKNQDEDTLVINDEAIQILNSISQPVVVVAIVGRYRTGKSYLMNKLAGKCSGFALGATVQSKTKGIWMWCILHPTKPNHTLVLLDTEGLGDVEKGDSNNDAWIFSLAILLSSTLVYNSVTTIDQDSLDKLHYVTELTELIKVKSTNDLSATNEEEEEDESADFKKFFPNFIWCVRDFFLKLEMDNKVITEDEYLHNALRLKQGCSKSKAQYNRPRECILHYFHAHKCFAFERPAYETDLQRLEELTESQLSPSFLHKAKQFCEFVYETSKVKRLQGGHSVTGRMLGSLATSYVESIKNGSIPCMENAVLSLATVENTAATKEGLSIYMDKMSQGDIVFPMEQEDFLKLHSDCENMAVEAFLKRSFKDDKREYQTKLMIDLNQKFNEFRSTNEEASIKKCKDIIQELDASLEQKIKNGDFSKPGGHKEFVAEKQRILNSYENIPAKGVKAKEVLEEFLKNMDSIEKSILSTDSCLSKIDKERELEKMRNEALAYKLQLETEERERLQQIQGEQKKNLEAQLQMLMKKLENERSEMKREFEWVIDQKQKEKDIWMSQGFKNKAGMLDLQIEDLEKKKAETGMIDIVMNGVGLLADAASLVLPGVCGKVAKGAAILLNRFF
ncbi:guanylate-binding protein 1-like [Spea bombifrons]|uniref:guanylate-binding protein 1-like n=1 Tax=Spea bombifrons TaxID=233779 RepID=UPI00234A3E0A|nr:guanylate-binding protein 1-like [Spea bombifrons]